MGEMKIIVDCRYSRVFITYRSRLVIFYTSVRLCTRPVSSCKYLHIMSSKTMTGKGMRVVLDWPQKSEIIKRLRRRDSGSRCCTNL